MDGYVINTQPHSTRVINALAAEYKGGYVTKDEYVNMLHAYTKSRVSFLYSPISILPCATIIDGGIRVLLYCPDNKHGAEDESVEHAERGLSSGYRGGRPSLLLRLMLLMGMGIAYQ